MELGAGIAKVIKDEDISGLDFLDPTENEEEKMFSKVRTEKEGHSIH